MSAGFAPPRLAAALGASLLAHMVLLASFGSLPGARPDTTAAPLGAPFLVATFRPESREEDRPATKRVQVPARGLPAVPAPRYHAAHELDERPLILTHVEPEFPSGVTPGAGRVTLQLYIGEKGTVDSVEVLDAEPAGAFEAAAREAFASARYRPGFLRGAAVKSTLAIEVLFGLPLPADPAIQTTARRDR